RKHPSERLILSAGSRLGHLIKVAIVIGNRRRYT
ncbi:MAG: hypothetical protein ACI9JM_003374, partial [Halioglobus sp.]